MVPIQGSFFRELGDFSSTYGGQANQAAAIALAYYKAACNPMIDAFIIRSYKDEAHEVAQGLAMGLKDANGKRKQRIMSLKIWIVPIP